eukprot:11736542-Ditylum_brightwellii.AAC.1
MPCGRAFLHGCHSPDSCNSLGMLLEKVIDAVFTQVLEYIVQLDDLCEVKVGAGKEGDTRKDTTSSLWL